MLGLLYFLFTFPLLVVAAILPILAVPFAPAIATAIVVPLYIGAHKIGERRGRENGRKRS